MTSYNHRPTNHLRLPIVVHDVGQQVGARQVAQAGAVHPLPKPPTAAPRPLMSWGGSHATASATRLSR